MAKKKKQTEKPKKIAKATTKSKAARRKKAEVAGPAAAEAVKGIQVAQEFGENYLLKMERLKEMDGEIERLTGERKNKMTDRAKLKNELDNDAIEMAGLVAHNNSGSLFTGHNVGHDKKKLAQSSVMVRSDAAQASTDKADKKKRELKVRDAVGSEKLDYLGVKGKLRELLESDGIRTIADLQKWISAHPRRSIKGIGEEKIAQLGDQYLEAFTRKQKELEVSPAAGLPEIPAPPSLPAAGHDDGMVTTDAIILCKVDKKLLLRIAPTRGNSFVKYEYVIELGNGIGTASGWTGEYLPNDATVAIVDAFEAARESLEQLVDDNAGNKDVEVSVISLHSELEKAELEKTWEKTRSPKKSAA